MARTRSFRACLAALAPVVTGACYSYNAYVPDRPVPSTVVELTLNDRGRAALEQRIGPEVFRIEGVVASAADSQFTLRVRRVVAIDRNIYRWGGEAVTFRLEYLREWRERRFSRARTVLLAGTLSASAVAFFATRTLLGFGGDREGPTTSGPGDSDH